MNTKPLLLALVLSTIGLLANAQTLEWAKAMGGTGRDEGYSIAVDASGNVYTTGEFDGNADFDPGVDSFMLNSGMGGIFVSKLDASGNFVWAKQIGGRYGGYSIAVDASENVYITGYFRGTADFDPGGGVFNLSSTGGADAFISKLDASGNFVWAKQIGGVDDDQGSSIAVDALGNVYTTGGFKGMVDFDPGVGAFHLTSAGSYDVFISKLDASGSFVWAKGMAGTDSDVGASISVDASGNIYTTGAFQSTVDFDPGIGAFNLSAADTDIFISKLDASGNFVWAKKMGGIALVGDVGFSIAVDALGNVYTTGDFEDTADFDPGAGTFNLSSAGISDIFISKLNASGDFEWAKRIGGTGRDVGYSIVVDSHGYVYTTGYFRSTADFDPGAGTFNLSSVGTADIFISKLDASGNFVWATQMGGSFDVGRSIAIDASGNIYTTGIFEFTGDFDPGVGIFNLTSAGSIDIFVQKLSQTTTSISTHSLNKTATLYPNPTSGQVNILLDENTPKATVIVRNYLGQEIFRESYTSTTTVELTIEGPAGLYIVEIWNADEKAVAKVVKY